VISKSGSYFVKWSLCFCFYLSRLCIYSWHGWLLSRWILFGRGLAVLLCFYLSGLALLNLRFFERFLLSFFCPRLVQFVGLKLIDLYQIFLRGIILLPTLFNRIRLLTLCLFCGGFFLWEILMKIVSNLFIFPIWLSLKGC
jgi:hypothetical protein